MLQIRDEIIKFFKWVVSILTILIGWYFADLIGDTKEAIRENTKATQQLQIIMAANEEWKKHHEELSKQLDIRITKVEDNNINIVDQIQNNILRITKIESKEKHHD